MGRIHLFEFGDMAWLPKAWHQYATDYLAFIAGAAKSQVLAFAPPVKRLLDRSPERGVVDLCSGGAGPWPVLVSEFAEPDEEFVTLTDRSPNLAAFERARARSDGRIRFIDTPVDASDVPSELSGARTIFNGFHHFRPELARAVLEDAARQGKPIGIFELVGRSAFQLITSVLIPLFVLFSTPFIRPFRIGRLFWTFLIPIMPLLIWWDGVVSMLRVYSERELTALIQNIDHDGYTWEVSSVKVGPVAVPYLIGYPTPTSE